MDLASIVEDCVYSNILSATLMGSHLWGQARADSDYDVFMVLMDPIDRVLFDGPSHKPRLEKCEIDGIKLDIMGYEISDVAIQLMGQDINSIIGVTGIPIIETDITHFLYDWVMRNKSKRDLH